MKESKTERDFKVFKIAMLKSDLMDELEKWRFGNEEAGQRARVKSLRLQKLLKEFRKESVRMYKERLRK